MRGNSGSPRSWDLNAQVCPPQYSWSTTECSPTHSRWRERAQREGEREVGMGRLWAWEVRSCPHVLTERKKRCWVRSMTCHTVILLFSEPWLHEYQNLIYHLWGWVHQGKEKGGVNVPGIINSSPLKELLKILDWCLPVCKKDCPSLNLPIYEHKNKHWCKGRIH